MRENEEVREALGEKEGGGDPISSKPSPCNALGKHSYRES